jgi:hypothetical protein
VQTIQIDITVDGGDNWIAVTGSGGISQTSPSWGDYTWTVPVSFGTHPAAVIRVAQYGNPSIAGMSGEIAIDASGARGAERHAGGGVGMEMRETADGIAIGCRVPCDQSVSVVIYNLTGKRVATLQVPAAAGVVTWRAPEGGGTAYVVQLQAPKSGSGVTVLASRLCRVVR